MSWKGTLECFVVFFLLFGPGLGSVLTDGVLGMGYPPDIIAVGCILAVSCSSLGRQLAK
ncbi:hypothetical protein V8F06_001318 [Rhypophila decipiens]